MALKYFMAQNYRSNGNLRASQPSENNGLACNKRATRSHQTGWQWRRMRICSARQRMMAHWNKWMKSILMSHTLTTWTTPSHCTLHQIFFYFSLSSVLKCGGIFTPRELGGPSADCKENTLHQHFRDFWMGGGRLPQLFGGEISDGSWTPFCLALSWQNQLVFRVSMKNDVESNWKSFVKSGPFASRKLIFIQFCIHYLPQCHT
jgi:hypothetical protein